MKTVIVGFSKPIKPTLFSRAISWAGHTEFDHVYIKWTWATVNRDIIYQASKLAVNFETNTTFETHAIALEEYEIQISDECYKTIMQYCMDNSDKPYGLKEILGDAWVVICGRFGKKINNPFPSYGNSFVCSKLITEILQITGTVSTSIVSDNIMPADLNALLKSSGLKRIK